VVFFVCFFTHFPPSVTVYSVIVFLLTAYWQRFLSPAAFPSKGCFLDTPFGLSDT